MKRILAICFMISICSQAQAVPHMIPGKLPDYPGRFYVGAGGGMLFPMINKSQYVPTGSTWPDDHYITTKIANQPFWFLAGGYTWSRPETWLPYYSLGFRYMYVYTMTTKGYINQYSLPDFRNYSFSYDIQQQNLLAILKADIVRWRNFMPYLMGGLGISMNSTSSYGESPTQGVTPRVNPGFGSYTNYNFAYTAGAGIDWIVQDNVWINIEYSYSDFGSVTTGKGRNYATLTDSNFSSSNLKNSITANTLLLGVTYFIG